MTVRTLALGISLALVGTAAAGGLFPRRTVGRDVPSVGASTAITLTQDPTLVTGVGRPLGSVGATAAVTVTVPAPSVLPSEPGDFELLRIQSEERAGGRVVCSGRIINASRRGFSVLHFTLVAQELDTGAVVDDGADASVTSFGPGAQVEFAVESRALHRYLTLGPSRCRLYYRRGASRILGGSPIPAERQLYRFKGTPRLRD